MTAIDDILARATASGAVVGAVALAGTDAGEAYAGAAGVRCAGQPEPMTLDSVFWLASMTKPIVSAAAMQLVEQGRLELDQDAGALLPWLADPQVLDGWTADGAPVLRPARGPVTLRRLLTHTAGFCYDMWNPDVGRYMAHAGIPGTRSCRNAALAMKLMFDPGARWEYGIGIDQVGKLIEAASGQRLDAYLDDHLLGPLGMTDTSFRLRPDQRARLAAMHARQPDGGLAPVAFELPAEPEFHMGGGGLYGTGRDYLAFMRMILNDGRAGAVRVLRPETVAAMAANQIGALRVRPLVSAMAGATHDAEFFPGLAKTWGFGFMITNEAAPTGRGAGSLAWAGLGNTYFWIDPARRVSGVLLTQSLPFADPAALDLFDGFERAVYAAL